MSEKELGENKQGYRQYPNNFGAEQYVLCCMLIDGEVLADVAPTINSDYFYNPRHKTIFEAAQSLFNKGVSVNVITVNDVLTKTNKTDIDMLGYLTDLSQITPSAVNYRDHLNILRRDMIMRRLIAISKEIAEDAYTSQDADQSVNNAERLVYGINLAATASGLEHIEAPSSRFLRRLEQMAINPSARKGLCTHFPIFDKITNGLQPSSLIILAARPSVGKTSFALNIISNIIKEHEDAVVAMFSLEMSAEQLVQRILASNTGVDMGKLSSARLSESDQSELWSAHVEASNCRIYFDSTSMQTPGNIASKCRRLKSMTADKRLDLVIVDYLQLMANDKDKIRSSSSRQTDVSDISRMMKIMAMELQCPVIALSQMSRSIEGRDDKQPRLSDLRESGAIEQDADMVMFLSRENEEEKTKEACNIILDIAKHRNGELAQIRYVWEGRHVRFTESSDQTMYAFPKTSAKKKSPSAEE